MINHFQEKLRIDSEDYHDYDTVQRMVEVVSCLAWRGVNNYIYEVS